REDESNHITFEKIGEVASSTSFAHVGFRLHTGELLERIKIVKKITQVMEKKVRRVLQNDTSLLIQAAKHLDEERNKLEMLMQLATKQQRATGNEEERKPTKLNNITKLLQDTEATSVRANTTREKRQVILGAGMILSFGIGTYNSYQIAKLSDAIRNMEESQHLVTEQLHQQDLKINQVLEQLNEFYDQLMELVKTSAETGGKLATIRAKQNLIELQVLVIDTVRDYRVGIERLMDKRVSPSFIHPAAVETTFKKLVDKAKAKGMRMLDVDWGLLFRSECSVIIRGSDLEVIIHVPLVKGKMLDLYR
ncbi:Hypothetical predicted protein, partial [Paramuricea clavata]